MLPRIWTIYMIAEHVAWNQFPEQAFEACKKIYSDRLGAAKIVYNEWLDGRDLVELASQYLVEYSLQQPAIGHARTEFYESRKNLLCVIAPDGILEWCKRCKRKLKSSDPMLIKLQHDWMDVVYCTSCAHPYLARSKPLTIIRYPCEARTNAQLSFRLEAERKAKQIAGDQAIAEALELELLLSAADNYPVELSFESPKPEDLDDQDIEWVERELDSAKRTCKEFNDRDIAKLKSKVLVVGPAIKETPLSWLQYKLLEYVLSVNHPHLVDSALSKLKELSHHPWHLSTIVPGTNSTIRELFETLHCNWDAGVPEAKWVIIQNQADVGLTKCGKGNCPPVVSPNGFFKVGELVYINPMTLELRCLHCGPTSARGIDIVYDPYRGRPDRGPPAEVDRAMNTSQYQQGYRVKSPPPIPNRMVTALGGFELNVAPPIMGSVSMASVIDHANDFSPCCVATAGAKTVAQRPTLLDTRTVDEQIQNEFDKLFEITKKMYQVPPSPFVSATLPPTPEATANPPPEPPKPEPREDVSCVVCLDLPRTWIIMPCGHRHFCEGCAKRLKNCATCRGPIQYRCKVYE